MDRFKMADASTCLKLLNVSSMYTNSEFLLVSWNVSDQKASEELIRVRRDPSASTWPNVDGSACRRVVVGSCVGGGVRVMFWWTQLSVVKVSDTVSHGRGVWFYFHPPVNFLRCVFLLNSACLFSTDAGWDTSLWWGRFSDDDVSMRDTCPANRALDR